MSENLYTTVASSMAANTDIVNARMAPVPVGQRRRVVQLTAPGGPSSEKGQLTRQPLVLKSDDEQLACGFVDFVNARAELKDFEALRSGYEARYKRPLDVREDEYRALLQKLQEVLRELQVRAQVVGSDAAAYAPTDPATLVGRASPGRAVPSALPFVLVVGLLVLLVFGALFFVAF